MNLKKKLEYYLDARPYGRHFYIRIFELFSYDNLIVNENGDNYKARRKHVWQNDLLISCYGVFHDVVTKMMRE